MIDELIKMYEQYKKQAKERGENDVAEYYSQTIVNLKRRKLNQGGTPKSPRKVYTERLQHQRKTLSTFQPRGKTHFERLQHLANAVNKTNKNNT